MTISFITVTLTYMSATRSKSQFFRRLFLCCAAALCASCGGNSQTASAKSDSPAPPSAARERVNSALENFTWPDPVFTGRRPPEDYAKLTAYDDSFAFFWTDKGIYPSFPTLGELDFSHSDLNAAKTAFDFMTSVKNGEPNDSLIDPDLVNEFAALRREFSLIAKINDFYCGVPIKVDSASWEIPVAVYTKEDLPSRITLYAASKENRWYITDAIIDRTLYDESKQ